MSTTLQIDMSNPAEKAMLLRSLNDLRGPTEITIKRKLRLRSNAANRFYRGVLVPAFQKFLRSQGQVYSAEMCHRMLASRFLKVSEYNQVTGEFLGEIVRSTTELNVQEFREYCEHVETFLVELGARIPSGAEFAGGERNAN